MDMDIKEREFTAIFNNLDKMNQNIEEEITKEMMDITDHYIVESRKVAPVLTGALRESIDHSNADGSKTTQKPKFVNGILQMFVGSNLPYTARREYEQYNAKVPGTGRFYFKNTLAKFSEFYTQRLVAALNRALRK